MHHRNPTECVCRSGTATLLQEELISSARADSEWLRLRTSLQCLLPIQVGLVPAHDRCQMLNQKKHSHTHCTDEQSMSLISFIYYSLQHPHCCVLECNSLFP